MPYLAPSQTQAIALIRRAITGPVTMLNLLKFKDIADYSAAPHLAPDSPIPGREAYEKYVEGIRPLLETTGGELIFSGSGGDWFIGPEGEDWDQVLLVRQNSVTDFLAFAEDPRAAEIGLHRSAALADSRLLPLIA